MRLHHPCSSFCYQIFKLDAVDEVQRVEDIAFRLRHLLAFGISNQTMNIDIMEGDLVGKLKSEHDHSSHPEEDDVETGYENIGWIESIELWCLIWPAQGGKGPQC